MAASVFPRAARATGGLDVDASGEVVARMRVLLATGSFPAAQPIDAWHFAWNGRTYRGSFETVALPGGENGLVNTLPLDAYLYGVLSKEISPSWVPATQQAQAIVTRTYSLFKLKPERAYDVIAGDADQNYGGIESESVEGRAAIDATSSTIVTYDAKPAHVAYSACCGGATADSGEIWNTAYPYLRSVPDPNCASAPNYAWRASVSLDAVEGALGRELTTCGRVKDVALRIDPPGVRPRAIAFDGDVSSVETPIGIFRSKLGPNVVRSSFVRTASLDRGGATIALAGTGRGHGVGLCQWGARVLGAGGASAADIVAFYFPGTSLGRA